ncbi:MAG: [Clostridia bacterium]|nr:[FeFe] hydrogenase H-cluster radical SAM maturase HydE [Clostridia bacterium]
MTKVAEKLLSRQALTESEFEQIILNKDEYFDLFQQKAKEITEQNFGNEIFIRGLIEVSNVCRNDCLYCGIRKSNTCVERYVLEDAEILKSCEDGYKAGFRTFVLQGGETDKNYSSLVKKIKTTYPYCAVTLSLGEKTKEEYQELKDAGADRYLLRHETADNDHYAKLHPDEMSLENRMKCLKTLKEIGFQTGCGFMVGSPYQTPKTLAKDLFFIQEFKPHMVGIG